MILVIFSCSLQRIGRICACRLHFGNRRQRNGLRQCFSRELCKALFAVHKGRGGQGAQAAGKDNQDQDRTPCSSNSGTEGSHEDEGSQRRICQKTAANNVGRRSERSEVKTQGNRRNLSRLLCGSSHTGERKPCTSQATIQWTSIDSNGYEPLFSWKQEQRILDWSVIA